ncbi:MAG TPA: cytochrome c [Nitrospirales bacterium]|nr:cytochrome c [Nitrospirales bacterium]
MRAHRIGIGVMTGLAAWILWSGPAFGQRSKLERPNLDEGARIYKQNCLNCHGPAGKGDGIVAAQLDPKPADLTSAKTQQKEDADLLEVLKFGRPGTAMPGWMSEINEREMRDVLAYIRSIAP